MSEPVSTPANPFPLDRVERWMQAVLVHPDSPEAGLVSEAAEAEIPSESIAQVIREGGQLSPVERLGVYHDMYLLRMRDGLEVDYPALADYMGHHAFTDMVRDFIQVYPSRSYTLNRLSDPLPKFLETWGKARGRRLLTDLARLELAMTEVFDEAEVPSLMADEIASIPSEAWESARFTPIAAFRLVSLTTAANDVFTSYRDETPLPPLRRKNEYVAVYRKDYGVRRFKLTHEAFQVLGKLAEGKTLGDALSFAARKSKSLAPETISGWFRDWIAEGFFGKVTLNP